MKPKQFYVYELVDPRDGKPFYVGKGQRDRVSDHVREANRGVHSHKCNKIRSIQNDGLAIQTRIVKEFRNEDAAYRFEEKHIASIGLDKLTNIAPGGRANGGGISLDSAEVDLIATCLRKTAGFTVFPRLHVLGQTIEIGSVLHDIGRRTIDKLLEKHGDQWLIDKLAKKKVLLTVTHNSEPINAV
jgi:hypothetical protein